MNFSFVHPQLLYALGFVAIPVIIHLFNFRKFKKVYFTNVRFLKEVKTETQSKSKLKHLLVLASRVLAIIALVLAFAQPFIPVNKTEVTANGNDVVCIFIDNSFSMNGINKNGLLLDDAKRKAKEIMMAYRPSTKFQLLTCDFDPKHQHLYNRDQLTELVNEIAVSPNSRTIPEILARQHDAINNGSNAVKGVSYILSDFQKTMVDAEKIKNDSLLSVNLIPIESNTANNIYIDSCWLSAPVVQLNQVAELNVRIKNNSGKAVENVPVKLMINDSQKALGTLTAGADASVIMKLTFTITEPGIKSAKVVLTDYPIIFDDSYYFSFNVAVNTNILSLNGSSQYNQALTALFGKDGFILLKNMPSTQPDYSAFKTNQVIVLNELPNISSGLAEELAKYIKDGGTIVLFPAANIDVSSYAAFMNAVNAKPYSALITSPDKVNKINLQQGLYKDVFDKVPENIDLPQIKQQYNFTSQTRSNQEVLLKTESNNAFLSKYTLGNGNLYVFSVGLSKDFSNFTEHSLFVPTLYKIALSSSKSLFSSFTIGSNNAIDYHQQNQSGADEVLHVTNANGFDIIPEHRLAGNNTVLYLHNQVTEAGIYNVLSNGKTENILAFNYNRKESDLSKYTSGELKDAIDKFKLDNINIFTATEKDLTKTIQLYANGISLWKLMIILVLLFLAIEIALLKFLK